MRTPVPKCLERNRNLDGTGMPGKRLTTMGKEHAVFSQATARTSIMRTLTCGAQAENEKQGKYMDACVVMLLCALRPAFWLHGFLLPALKLAAEQFGSDMRKA